MAGCNVDNHVGDNAHCNTFGNAVHERHGDDGDVAWNCLCKVVESIFKIELIIRKPTIIRAGAVAKDGMAKKIGDRNRDRPKNIAATTDVSPVLPPSATP